MTEATPIKTYTPLTEEQRALGNAFKEIEEGLLRLVDLARDTDLDGRWVSVAATHFQEGFMALNRANFKPERIDGVIGWPDSYAKAVVNLVGRRKEIESGMITADDIRSAKIVDANIADIFSVYDEKSNLRVRLDTIKDGEQ